MRRVIGSLIHDGSCGRHGTVRVISMRPAGRSLPSSQNTTSPKVRWMSMRLRRSAALFLYKASRSRRSVVEASVDPQPRGPDWMPITPKTGSLFHACSHPGDSMLGRRSGEVCLSGPFRVWFFGPRPFNKRDVAIGIPFAQRLKNSSRHSPPFLDRTHSNPLIPRDRRRSAFTPCTMIRFGHNFSPIAPCESGATPECSRAAGQVASRPLDRWVQ
jgi:hypothetical protein